MVRKELTSGLPLFIAGPCGIESEAMVMETAGFVRGLANHFRGRAEFVFKSSFLKDNRTSAGSWAGPGMKEGLRVLGKVREEFDLALLTDIHTADQALPVSRVCQILQIPAFLCRQTSLLAAAGRHRSAGECEEGAVHVSGEHEGLLINSGNPAAPMSSSPRGEAFSVMVTWWWTCAPLR